MKPTTGLILLLFWLGVAAAAFRPGVVAPEPERTEETSVAGTSCTSVPEAALVWLARHQEEDGHWSTTGYPSHCTGPETCDGARASESDLELTSISLLCYLGAGYTPQNRATYVDPHTRRTMRFGEVVRRGVKYLIDHQNRDGEFRTGGPVRMRHQALASLALSEAFGITNARAYRGPAQRSVAYIESARSAKGVWGIAPGDAEVDDLTSGECFMAVKSAQISGLDVSEETVAAVKSWTRTPIVQEGAHPTEAAHRLLSQIFAYKRKSLIDPLGEIVLRDLPSADAPDFGHWQVATYALFQLDGPGGPCWRKWNKGVANVLCSTQALVKDGCRDGSWSGPRGRLRSTVEATLTLQVYYRYASVFGSSKRGG